MNVNLRLPILAALLAALLVAAPSSAGTVHDGSLGSAAKKKKPKSCKHKRGKKKRKCKKAQQEAESTKPSVASVVSLICPTGTVSGSVPATISGIATPPGEPVIIEYRHWDGTKFIDHVASPSEGQFYFDAVTPNPATGAWSFSFLPNRRPWDPAMGTWTETVRVSYSGGAAASAAQLCSWLVSA